MTTQYIKITNVIDKVPRVNLEKLGLSTKRNDPNTIGQFGSGIKFAPIAALRNGWEWWFTGRDANGEYKMQYTTEVEDGIECVVFDYGDYKKSSSFTIDAGRLSWIDSFQIYREAVANAMDEAKNDLMWSISVVDAEDIVPKYGEFSVYITAAPELLKIHYDFDKYFCINRRIVGVSRKTEFISKIDSNMRVYCHGVLVHQNDQASVYDYNNNELALNEERNIKSTWDFEYELTRCIIHNTNEEIIQTLLESDKSGCKYFEWERFQSSILNWEDASISWANVFHKIHGDSAVIYDENSVSYGVFSAIKMRGYEPVLIHSNSVFQILKSAGVRDYLSILGEGYNLDINHDTSQYPNVSAAMRIVTKYIPEFSQIVETNRFGIFSSDMERSLGVTINMKKPADERMILINKEHVNDSIENIVATIVHEIDHLQTGITDEMAREFRDLADRRLASLMTEYYRDQLIYVDSGRLKIPVNNIQSFGTPLACNVAIINSMNTIIVKIANKLFTVNSDCVIENSTSIVTSQDGLSFEVSGISDVTSVNEVYV